MNACYRAHVLSAVVVVLLLAGAASSLAADRMVLGEVFAGIG